MNEATFESNSSDDTLRLGERLGGLLQLGDVVLLSGELGAGKTMFVQGIASSSITPTSTASTIPNKRRTWR